MKNKKCDDCGEESDDVQLCNDGTHRCEACAWEERLSREEWRKAKGGEKQMRCEECKNYDKKIELCGAEDCPYLEEEEEDEDQ